MTPIKTLRSYAWAPQVVKFDDDEARNAHGEWTSGGGDDKAEEVAPHLDDASRAALTAAGVPIASDEAWDNLARSMNTGTPLDAKSNDEIATQMNGIMDAPNRGIAWTTQGGYKSTRSYERDEEEKAKMLAPYTVGVRPLKKDQYLYSSPHLSMQFKNDLMPRTISYADKHDLERADEVEKNPLYQQLELASRYSARGGLTTDEYGTGHLPLTMNGGLVEGSIRTQNLLNDQRANLDDSSNIRIPAPGAPYLQAGTRMLTSDQLQAVRAQMAQAVAGRPAAIQVNDNVIDKVAKGGTIGNLFTANKTNAAAGASSYYFDVRTASEGNIMGVPYNANGDARPVYGYLDDAKASRDYYTPSEVRLALMDEHAGMRGVTPGMSEEDAIAANRAFWDQQAADVRAKGVTPYEKDPESKAQWYEGNTDRALQKVDDVIAHPENYVLTLSRERDDHGRLYDSINIMPRSKLDEEVNTYAGKSYLTREDKQAVRSLAGTKVWPVAGPDGKINSALVSYMMSRDAQMGFTQYGTTKVTMKPDFMSSSKSTITFGDSLDNHPRVALPYDAVKNADPRLVVAANEPFIERNEDTGEVHLSPTASNYVETQMMRHPGLDDIQSVVFHGQAPSPSTVSKLNDAGIETTVVYPGLKLKDGQYSLKDRLPMDRL